MLNEIDTLRRTGVKLLTIAGWCITAAIAIASLEFGSNASVAALVSAALNVLPTLCMRAQRSDEQARLVVALMVAMQPALMLYAVQGWVWQVDMHMYFFVALATLTILCDVRAIIFASALVAVHHLVLAFAAPAWVFSGGGGIGRVMIHAVAVALQASIMCYISSQLTNMIGSLGRARDESASLAEASSRLAKEAQDALHVAEREREDRLKSEAEQAERRKADFERISVEFERSVRGVTAAVAETASLLEKSTKTIDEVAHETGDQASDVADSAVQASEAAKAVANGVAQLSQSIASIAVNVSQQNELTTHATTRSSTGSSVMDSLTERSDNIGEATRAIVGIADRTTLLSLNASIEAATAGEAGRGFTIVANEVKELAQQATEAAGRIDSLLSGVRDGTLEAEQNFSEIDRAISELSQAATAIRSDVETQRQSAGDIEDHAQRAASKVDDMAKRSKSLADKAENTKHLAGELDDAAAMLIENVRTLERSTDQFMNNLRAA